MTDARKWKSVMLRVVTYEKLLDIAQRQKRANASVLDELVTKEWEWNFDKANIQNQPDRIEKSPERIQDRSPPRNPFLRKTS